MTNADLLSDLLGSSPSFEEVKERARQLLARIRAGGRLPPVLIQGETGSGKGLLARTLHNARPHGTGRFIAVNCGAIPETLGESEFFGYARGAHSEARQSRVGLFQAADRGTIFLDEVGLLSEGHQGRLLKVIEDRQVTPVGSTTPVPVDVWIISATNADLWAKVQSGEFRRDLYERLAVITFVLPPLRERPDDILHLAERFLERSCSEYGLKPKKLAADARRRLLDHPWPGNIRELGNVLERAALLVETDTVPASRLELAPPPPAAPPPPPARPADRRTRVRAALERQGGNITRAAADLGVSRKTLRDWMKQEGLYQSPGAVRLVPTTAAGTGDAPTHSEDVPAAGEDARGSVPEQLPDDATTSGIHWEQRWIALMRVTLASAEGMTGLDPSRPLGLVVDKIQTFGARVIELGRAGLEAAFGLEPLEDAARRAASAALAIHRAGVRGRERSSDVPVTRIALHADSYLIGRVGNSVQIDQDAKQAGSAVLATLLANAGPDSVVVSSALLPFLRRRFELHGPMAEQAYRLIGMADRPAAFDRQISAFVGRESEIALLRSRWELAAQGSGQIVGIVGDPGVGKSRLVWEFLQREREGARVLETASVALGRPTPYLAIIELLRKCFGVELGEAEAAVRDKVVRHVAALDPSLEPAIPVFLTLLDVPSGDSAWDALDPLRRRRRTYDAIKRLMLLESVRQPLLLVFEDAHWADSETQALLEILATSLPAVRVLMLVTFRPEFQHPWSDRSFYTQLRVDPLRGEAASRFLRDLLGNDQSLEPLRARLIEWTGGNPFFLEETVWTLVESKMLEGARGAYRVVRPVTRVAVPETVQEALAARMARLGRPAFEILQCAAVVGRRVPADVLDLVSTVSADALTQALEVLQAREFLTETGLSEDAREYTFRHALTQEVAYASLPEPQRRALHARIVHAMERLYDNRLDDRIADVAHHAFEGQLWEKSVDYLHRAGARAFSRSANTEAAACFEHALVALSHLPEDRANRELNIDLRFSLRNALTPLAQAHRVLKHLREAERLAALLGDERRRARALSFAANSLCLVADYQAALDASRQARAHARSLGDFALDVAAGMYMGRAHAGLGEYHQAAAVLREVAESLRGDRTYDYLGLPVLPAVFSRSHLVLALAELGEFDEAERFVAEAVEIAEHTRQPDTLLWAYAAAGMGRLTRGDLPAATRALERALELCRTADMPVYVALVASPLGLAYARAGRVAEGLALAEQAVEQAKARRQEALLAWTLLRLGEARLLAGQADAAEAAAHEALALFRQHAERGGDAYALWLLESVAQSRGGRRPAIEDVHALALRLGMTTLAARAAMSRRTTPRAP